MKTQIICTSLMNRDMYVTFSRALRDSCDLRLDADLSALDGAVESPLSPVWRSEMAECAVASLIDALEDNAPDGTFFGSRHEHGRGVVWAFWDLREYNPAIS